MKTLYLLRHAKSSWKDPSLGDFDRPLKGRGRRAAKAMARHLARQKWRPGLILCSAAARTSETLDYLLEKPGPSTPHLLDEALYMAGPNRLHDYLRGQDDGLDSLMLLGHNPGLEQLALRLTGTAEPEVLATMRAKYPTGALAVLHFDIASWDRLVPGGGRLETFLRPVDLSEEVGED